MNVVTPSEKLSPKDYASDQEIRWCPGCGDYAIARAVQKTLAEIRAARAQTVFVSGIGCASRFPYYMATFGFHTIHGRAPAIATGLKLANPDLDVWVVSGDGDALSIGGNHLLHVLRRNVNLQFLLFNNEIYGLTKGQYSPTTQTGTRTPSSPRGSVERPVSPVEFALGAGARFAARGVDTMQKHLPELLKRAHDHKGASFVEIFQNCIVYNDGAFNDFTARDVAADAQVIAQHGEPLIFGKDGNRGLRLRPDVLALEVVTVGENGVEVSDILIHDETNWALAAILAEMRPPAFPMALGVLYCAPAATYESLVWRDRRPTPAAAEKLSEMMRAGVTWSVGE